MSIDLETLTIEKAHNALVNKEYTVRELVDAYLAVIKEKDSEVHAYLEVYDDIDAQVEAAQKRIDDGSATELTGIPIALKDNILRKGQIASAASKMLENYRATYNSTVVEKLEKENVVFLGRLNCDEFAMGASTENSAFGPTKNPHDLTRVPGGTSGGSTAAVAMHGALVTLGSDTGGSSRQPASFCGVVGFKPTYGRVSRHGLIAMGSSFDVISPIAKNVSDAEKVFNVIKGEDRYDSTTRPDDPNAPTTGKKIGVPRAFLQMDGIEQAVLNNFETSLKKMEEKGYEIVDIELPHVSYGIATYYVLIPAEVSSNLARLDGVKYGLHVDGDNLIEDYFQTRAQGFGAETRRRILIGTYVLSAGYYDAYYGKATAVRELLREDYRNAFEKVDLIATPTAPTTAFKLGEKANDPLQMYLADIFTVSANLTGVPAISLPSGTTPVDGKELPIGFQLFAPQCAEQLLLDTSKTFLGE